MLDYCLIIIWCLWWAGWLGIGVSAKGNSQRESFISRLPHLIPLLVGPVVVFLPAFIQPWYPLDWELDDRWMISLLVPIGLGITCWARYHLGHNWSGLVTTKVDHQLVTSGPYKLVRHPIYTGIMIAVIGSALAVNTWGALVGALIWNSTYIIKLRHEEEILKKLFGISWIKQCDLVYDKLFPGVY